MTLIKWMLLIALLAFINTVVGFIGVKNFLCRVSAIYTQNELEDFKDMVRKQMYQALIQLILIFAPLIMGLYGIITSQLSFGYFLLFIIGVNGAMFIAGKIFKKIEEQVRSLPVNNQQLAEQYKTICKTWVKKPFPDF